MQPLTLPPSESGQLGLHMELQPGCGVASLLGKRRHRHPGRTDAGLSDTGLLVLTLLLIFCAAFGIELSLSGSHLCSTQLSPGEEGS